MAWQEIDAGKAEVSVAYILEEESETDNLAMAERSAQKRSRTICGFKVGDYDRKRPLILDPAFFCYSGFIGGSQLDKGLAVAVDEYGNAYVTGTTYSDDFPVLVGPGLIGYVGDIFVAKIDSAGTGVFYCGVIGGRGLDEGSGIAVDRFGNAYITGLTDCSDFPVVTGPDLTYNGRTDAFIIKLNASGTALIYSWYVGGSEYDYSNGLAVDDLGNAYITGCTYSSDFPAVIGPYLTNNGRSDVFVAKVNNSGTGFIYSGYIGGSREDSGSGIAVDKDGNAYITSYTSSNADFPVINGPDWTYNGGYDAFVARVNASGSKLDFCSYLGGSSDDWGIDIALDSSNNVYITGLTYSPDFPFLKGPFLTNDRYFNDAFLS